MENNLRRDEKFGEKMRAVNIMERIIIIYIFKERIYKISMRIRGEIKKIVNRKKPRIYGKNPSLWSCWLSFQCLYIAVTQ